jgi:hypothetical protein
MEPKVLTDKSVFPNDDQVFAIIGENRLHWQKLMHAIHDKYPDAEEVWKYYNDGKSWLFRILRKKKTLFWIGVLKDTFRITFYFGEKAEALIEKSDLPDTLKTEFKNGKQFGKIRGITIEVSQEGDIDNALRLAEIRAALK